MGVWRNWFPIALAILWVLLAAMAVVDFASFSAARAPRRSVATEVKPVHSELSQRHLSPAGVLHD